MLPYRKSLILGAVALLTAAIFMRNTEPVMPFDEKLLSSERLREEATRLLDQLSENLHPEEAIRRLSTPETKDDLSINFPLLYSILDTAKAESHLLVIPFGDVQTLCIRSIQRSMLKDVSDLVYIVPHGVSFEDPEFADYRWEFSGARRINEHVFYRRTYQSR